MKKIIIAIAIGLAAVIVVFAAISGISYFSLPSVNSDTATGSEAAADGQAVEREMKDGEKWFYINTEEEILTAADEYGCETESDDQNIAVKEVEVCGTAMYLEYILPDGNKAYGEMIALMVPFPDEFESDVRHTGAELKEKTASAISVIERISGAEIGGDFYIIDEKGLLDNQLDSSFDKVLSGDAYIDFSLRDPERTYWSMYSTFYENHVRFELVRCFDPKLYSDSIVNVDLK